MDRIDGKVIENYPHPQQKVSMRISDLNTVLRYSLADEGSFHSKLVEQPDDHTAHSVYADWLRENGKDATADFIQRSVGSQLVREGGQSPIHNVVGYDDAGKHTGGVQGWPIENQDYSAWHLNHYGSDRDGHLLQLSQSHNGRAIEWRYATDENPRPIIESLRKEGVRIVSTQLKDVKDLFSELDEEEPEQHRSLERALKYTLATEADFHNALHSDSNETLHAGAYADFLQEQGKDAHAEVIRHHIRHNGTGGVPTNELTWEEEGVPAKPSPRPALHTQVRVIPKYDLSNFEPVGHVVSLNQISPDRTKGITWETGLMGRANAHALRNRLLGEGAEKDPQPELDFGGLVEDISHVGEMPVKIEHSVEEGPIRYAAVPEHDIHPDYQPTGVAPRIGHLLNRIAGENSDSGLLAEGIVRTGDHSLLKILADKLDDDGHELKDAIDWRHAERGIKIDRALAGEIGRHQVVHRNNGVVETQPQSAGWTLSDWRSGTRGRVSRKRALDAVRRAVPDANRTDVVHSVLRLLDNQFYRAVSQPGPNYLPDYIDSHQPPLSRLTAHKEWAKELGGEGNPHQYPDTRPVNKRTYRLSELVEKYAAWKSPAKGMAVKESPLAVTAAYYDGGSFTPDLEKLSKTVPEQEQPTKKPSLRTLLKRLRKRKAG